ncbi:hypothetical protein Pst134EB_029750 [Puccinia striiformis f. sp. tritici]|nr:hypothetical protein Pst134EB_029750 [Puccinia striiformis f. sp. tritici]
MASVISPLSPQSCHSSHAQMLALLGPSSSSSQSVPSDDWYQWGFDQGHFSNPSAAPSSPNPLYATRPSAPSEFYICLKFLVGNMKSTENNQQYLTIWWFLTRPISIAPAADEVQHDDPSELPPSVAVDNSLATNAPIGETPWRETHLSTAVYNLPARHRISSSNSPSQASYQSHGNRLAEESIWESISKKMDSDEQRQRGLPGNRYFGVDGRIHLLLLKNCYDRFRKKHQLHKYGVHQNAMNDRFLHPSLPTAMVPRSKKTSGKILRVMRGSSDLTQSNKCWLMLYKSLIGAVYELHQDLMNRLNVSTFVHKRQQDRLFDWLEDQIFSPTQGPPLMGIIDKPTVFWWQDNPFGRVQSELITYLAQEENQNERLYHTCRMLVETFYTQNEVDYPASIHPNYESFKEISASEDFKLNMAFLLNSIPVRKLAELDLPTEKRGIFNHHPFSWSTWSFAESFHPNDFKAWGGAKTLHPRLALAMSFVKGTNLAVLQVMRSKEIPTLVAMQDFYELLVKLIRQMDHFNLLVLKNLKIVQSQVDLERGKMLRWMIKSISKPRDSLPLIGIMKINSRIAPWEEDRESASNSYGKTQIKLIHYFSGDDARLDLENLAAFLVTTYYKEARRDFFKSWTEISEKHTRMQDRNPSLLST